jgi:hypothetical protein
MRVATWLIFGAVSALSLSHAADLSNDPSGLWKKFPGIYKIHSGTVADRTPPTRKDRKLTVLVDGAAARDIFDSIGPDLPSTCSADQGDRERRRRGIFCSYDAKDVKAKNGPYRCWVGVNLVTGEAENNVSC